MDYPTQARARLYNFLPLRFLEIPSKALPGDLMNILVRYPVVSAVTLQERILFFAEWHSLLK